jgi:hypothetical protein
MKLAEIEVVPNDELGKSSQGSSQEDFQAMMRQLTTLEGVKRAFPNIAGMSDDQYIQVSPYMMVRLAKLTPVTFRAVS